MTIKDQQAFLDGVWDWAILDGCFGTSRIKPTDVDGLIERKGKFLMLETKAPGVPIPDGQRRMHEVWVRRGDSVIMERESA